MTTPADDASPWLARSREILARTALQPEATAFGRVERVADGIAQVSGLAETRLNEVLSFDGGKIGFALTLEENQIAAVLLDEAATIEAGSRVSGTGDTLKTPVGPGLLGRVVDPLGRALDEGPPIAPEAHLPIERPAPAIADRALVEDMLQTGVLVVDSLLTIGRGQRELIIGDRATGKTALAVDAIINQKETDVVCVYVAVGQRITAIERVMESIRRYGAPERCIFVVASAGSSAGLQWIAPFSGFTIAEYFRDRGRHALVVVDDLTKHAATHRELALLTHQPAGREAYPGDIFYVHARLLERAARLSDGLGGGSLTALPIAETDAGNLSAYIPTNLISITDGQIVLDSRLFSANQRPAVNVGLSVSRVGGKAQHPALRQASGHVRLQYAQFLELEMFTRFGGIADPRVKARIARGERLRALFTQPRFATLRILDQVALLAAQDEGAFDDASLEAVAEARRRLPAWLDAHASDLPSHAGPSLAPEARGRLIAEVKALTADIVAEKAVADG